MDDTEIHLHAFTPNKENFTAVTDLGTSQTALPSRLNGVALQPPLQLPIASPLPPVELKCGRGRTPKRAQVVVRPAVAAAVPPPLRCGGGRAPVPNILKNTNSSSRGTGGIKQWGQTVGSASLVVPPAVKATNVSSASTLRTNHQFDPLAAASRPLAVGRTAKSGGRSGSIAKSRTQIQTAAASGPPPFPAAGVHHDHSALFRPLGQGQSDHTTNKKWQPAASSGLQAYRGIPQGALPAAPGGDDQEECLPDTSENYIGDLDRTWALFEKLDATRAAARGRSVEALAAAAKSEQFMSRLDRWGDESVGMDNEEDHHRQLPFSGFLRATQLDLSPLGVPADWADAELFSELDERFVAESVFLKKWLPKCAPVPRSDTYRTYLRALNNRDPAFNLVW